MSEAPIATYVVSLHIENPPAFHRHSATRSYGTAPTKPKLKPKSTPTHVYVRNLEERVKPQPLRETLEAIFSEFGTIVDIVAKTNLRAKGQAFIVYEDAASAATAVEEAQGFVIFDKPMVLALARTRSDATVQSTGSVEELEAHRQRRIAERDQRLAVIKAEEQKKALARPAATGTAVPAAAHIPDEYLPPNKTLFVQNIPASVDSDALTEVFAPFPGFREVRLVPGRGLAFVEYEDETGAIAAKEATAGMELAEGGEGRKKGLKVTYQRQ